MSNRTEDIISLHGGVSQQDVSLRLAHQVNDSINAYHTIAEGTRKRNPTKLIKSNTTIYGESFIYSYNRGLLGEANEKYSIVYNANGLSVLDLNDGISQSVNMDASSVAYLKTLNSDGITIDDFTSNTGYAALTVKDTTYITNRNKKILTTGSASATVNDIGYIWIQRADPVDGYTYTMTVNGVTQTSSAKLSTSAVATDLASKFASASADGNIIRVTGTTSISISDSYGDQASSSFFNEVDSENDLPKSFPEINGFGGSVNVNPKVEIVGSTNYASNYWLEYRDGRWQETVGENVITELDASTMPHQIIRNANGTFTMSQVVWGNRLTGDDDNSEQPSFVNSQIVDVFFFKNRLGFLTPNSVVFSETSEWYNFWRTTQVAVLDSDRIDVDIESQQAIRLHYVSFLEDDIVIFGDKSQFRITHDGILSINTISATMITEYDFNSAVRPLSIDSHIYFLAANGEYNALYVYNTEGITSISRANPVTGHIPTYLDKDIASMVGSSVNSVLFFRSKADTSILYVYKYLYDGDKLLQSSWFKWKFAGNISEAFTTESELHLLIARDESIFEDISVTYNGTWNDDKIWVDTEVWKDLTSTVVNNLESIQLVPYPVSYSYLDNGTVGYSSEVEISEYLPRDGDTVMLSPNIALKTLAVRADKASGFRLKIDNANRGTSRIIDEQYVLNRKPYIMGKSKDTRMSILSRDDKGFRIDGYSIESNITQRSQQI